MVSVQISEAIHVAGLKECKNYLHGRILLEKGDKLLTHLNLCTKFDVA